MTTVAIDSDDDDVTVPSYGRNAEQSLASVLTAVREDVLRADCTDQDDVVGATLRALERHLPGVSLPDILELRVLVDTNATDPESVFADTTEQALDHLATWH
ncbi:hypothetical protein [Halorubellus litoreus]|uniref:Uncharacterized protein n=1 Tax=Halorubellus litoreus TaxID=755308 RepID=A0ABD5VHB5_9EURY